ncbi:MAG TPA: hypothetical protein VEU29_06535 [Actinomycetota bacterium]|nr:hypothetical protein [Actinomycetota bacterium]
MAAIAAVVGVIGAFAVPAQASDAEVPPPCEWPDVEPLCDMAKRQVEHAVAEAEAATDYALTWGDRAIAIVNDTYAMVRCDVLGECS